jgi:hypothetical protein
MIIACWLLVLGLSVFVMAQQAHAGLATAENSEGRIRLDVLVTDAMGKPVLGLTQKDFTLLDNNQAQKVASFRTFNNAAKPDPPSQVILLFDTVNNGFSELAYIRKGVEEFLLQNGGILPNRCLSPSLLGKA